jgi:polyphosphate kinase
MEENGIKRYVHLGTGNYNDITAKLYTDLSLMTCNIHIGSDASMLFNMLSGNSKIEEMHKLYISPINLRDKVVSLIDREIRNAGAGSKAHIIIKINSLVDDGIIEKLYEASRAGVRIDLIVRGICALKPGISGLSENIRVISIVGRFLEHSRIFYFYNNSEDEIYLSSADLMRRNLDRRVELLFPVEDSKSKAKIKKIIEMALKDNVRARHLMSDGKYKKSSKRSPLFDFQEEMLKTSATKYQKKEKIKEFRPITKV